VIIPCYNEKNTIKRVVDKVKSSSSIETEIIIVDDHSTDGTREILENEISPLVDKIVYHEKNMGKGAAIRSGVSQVTGDIVIIQDADLEYDPQEYPILLAPILDNKADVVYGSRFIGDRPHRVLYFWHSVGNKWLTLASNMFSNLNLTDMETGSKAFRSEIIRAIPIQENRFGFEPEITAKIAKLNCRIFEVGISYNGRKYSEGKKIGWKDGVKAIYCILKYNLLDFRKPKIFKEGG